MPPETECVLHVEHQHVQLEARAVVHDGSERLERGDLAPRNVEHDSAQRQVGCVLDLAARDAPPGVHDLGERFHRPAQASRSGADEFGAFLTDRDPVRLAGIALAPQGEARADPVRVRVGLDRKPEPEVLVQACPERPCRCEVGVRGVRAEHDREPVAKP